MYGGSIRTLGLRTNLAVEAYISLCVKEKGCLWFEISKVRKAILIEMAKKMFDRQIFAGP